MKKTINLFLFYLFMNQLMGQPTFNNYLDYQPGEIFNYQKINLNSLPPIDSIITIGTSLTWDLSSLVLEDTVRENTILSCSESLYGSEYTDCSFVFKEYLDSIEQYYRREGDTLFYLGNTDNPTHSPSQITPDLPSVIYPIVFNTEFPETQVLVTSPFNNEFWTSSGFYKAYGTLILPNGITYSNVGLLYSEFKVVDGLYTAIGYNWVDNNNKSPLVRFQYEQTEMSNPEIQLAYINSEISLNSEENQEKYEILFYPNPTSDVLKIELKSIFEQVQVEIININGQNLFNENFGTVDNVKVNLSSMPTGLYIAKIKTEKGYFIKKIIKE